MISAAAYRQVGALQDQRRAVARRLQETDLIHKREGEILRRKKAEESNRNYSTAGYIRQQMLEKRERDAEERRHRQQGQPYALPSGQLSSLRIVPTNVKGSMPKRTVRLQPTSAAI